MLIDGKPATSLSANDRGLLYGDGLFETIALRHGLPRLWRYHMDRLILGAMRLGLPPPDPALLYAESRQEIGPQQQGVLRIMLTRGVSAPGYAPPARPQVTRCISAYPQTTPLPEEQPQRAKIRLCSTPLGWSPALAGLKHLNRLEQVLARSEWDDPDISEGLMCDLAGNVIEGTRSNLFVCKNAVLYTADLARGGIAGIMRRLVIEIAGELGIEVRVTDLSRSQITQADALLLTNSLIGIQAVASLDAISYHPHQVDQRLLDQVMYRAFSAPEPRE